MPPLSDFLDNPDRSGLSEDERNFFDALPPLMYEDGTPFDGTPKKVIFSDPIEFYDAEGKRLILNGGLIPPQQPLADIAQKYPGFSIVEQKRGK